MRETFLTLYETDGILNFEFLLSLDEKEYFNPCLFIFVEIRREIFCAYLSIGFDKGLNICNPNI
jgi:hypothetical protein